MTADTLETKMRVLDRMGIFVKRPLSATEPHILKITTQKGDVDLLGLRPEGEFEVLDNELLKEEKKEIITPIPEWNLMPKPVRHCLSVMDDLGFRLKAARYNEKDEEVYWVKTDGFGPGNDEIGSQNVLILFFNREGHPLRWEVKTDE